MRKFVKKKCKNVKYYTKKAENFFEMRWKTKKLAQI